jgi:hypothetical protein
VDFADASEAGVCGSGLSGWKMVADLDPLIVVNFPETLPVKV